jgi:hypothetical protein
MKQEKQQEIALMRYGAIAPIIAGLDERYPSKTAFYTGISAKGLMEPDGKLHHYAPATIEKWYLDYRNRGFEGLVPKGRSDADMSRKLDEELQERIRYFKTNYLRIFAAAIYKPLKSDGSVINEQVYEFTVSRFITGSDVFYNDFYRNFAVELGTQPAFRKTDNFKIIQDEINRLVLEKRQTLVIIIDEANYIRKRCTQ